MAAKLRSLSICLLLAGAAWWLWPQGELRHAPGIRVASVPMQEKIVPHVLPPLEDYTITAVARYALEGRVLHKKRYWSRDHGLVPFDIAVGWGAMSDQSVLDQLEISQGNRFFFYRWQNQPPIPQREIERQAANLHIIAADRKVAAEVARLRQGTFVTLRGFLVNVTGPRGFTWNTSLRRDDTGNGACELFYVEAAEVRPVPQTAALGQGTNFFVETTRKR